MRLPKTAKLFGWGGLLIGIGVVVVLAAWQGFDTIAKALLSMGAGFALLPLVFALHIFTSAWSWRLLFLPGHGPGYAALARAIWISFSVDVLLPLATVGGELVKLRLLAVGGVSMIDGLSSLVVDKTVQAISIVLWGLSGAFALLWIHADSELFLPALIGCLLLAIGVAGFVLVQVSGAAGFVARRFAGRAVSGKWRDLVDNAGGFDAAVRTLYRRRATIVSASLVRFAARLVLTLEVWLAAQLLGIPLTLAEALVIKSLTGALRSAAFVVPNGWGIQEGGFIVLGTLFGLPPDATLTLSLATRARELLVSLAGMLVWQQLEGSSWRRRLAGLGVEAGAGPRQQG